MHIVAWLLTQRAVETGEIRAADGRRPERRLGHASDSDPVVVDAASARGAAADHVQRRPLRAGQADRRGQMSTESRRASPARALMGRLERDLGLESQR